MGGLPYDVAVAFAAASAIVSFSAFGYIRVRGRGLNSMLLKLDSRAWLFGGLLSTGLCLSFGSTEVLRGTNAVTMGPYIDPVVLMAMTGLMAPFAATTVFKAAKDILQIAPCDLDTRVNEVARVVGLRRGFPDYESHVTRIGRARFVEIGFVAGSNKQVVSIAELDGIREEVSTMLGLTPEDWVTVYFTGIRRQLAANASQIARRGSEC